MFIKSRKWMAALTMLMAAFLFQSTCTVNVPRGAVLIDSFTTVGGRGHNDHDDDWDDDDWDDDHDDDFFFDFYASEDVYYDDGYYYGDSYGW